MKLRKFESGVVVIQHNMLSEAKVSFILLFFPKSTGNILPSCQILGTIKKLVELRDGRFPGINANDLSKELGISPSLAKEQLLIAESQGKLSLFVPFYSSFLIVLSKFTFGVGSGILCRDDSSEGLIFYHNFFL